MNLYNIWCLTVTEGKNIKFTLLRFVIPTERFNSIILTFLYNSTEVNTAHIAASKTLDLQLWHRHFGHLGIDAVKQLINQDMVGRLGPYFRLTIPCHLRSLHPWETAQRLISVEGIHQSITDPPTCPI